MAILAKRRTTDGRHPSDRRLKVAAMARSGSSPGGGIVGAVEGRGTRRKAGHEVLAELKADKDLRSIPVVVLTASGISEDVKHSCQVHAACHITKPVDLDQFLGEIKSIEASRRYVVRLPAGDSMGTFALAK